MLKNALLIVFLIACITSGFSQDKEKIKGDKNVIINETTLNPYNRIVVGEKFKIELFFAEKTRCQFPWWNKLVAATAIKKVNPAV